MPDSAEWHPFVPGREPQNDERVRYGQARSIVMDENNSPTKKYRLADGPMMLSEFNPKAVDRFRDRVCEVCSEPIMVHWLVPDEDLEKRFTYWCFPDRSQASTGMKI